MAKDRKERQAKWYRDNIKWVRKYNKDNLERTRFLRRGYRKPKAKFVDSYKLEKGCIVCGYNKCARSLDCHHRNEKEKKFTISIEILKGKYTLDEIKKELKKCDIMCKNCHGELHWNKERYFPKKLI